MAAQGGTNAGQEAEGVGKMWARTFIVTSGRSTQLRVYAAFKIPRNMLEFSKPQWTSYPSAFPFKLLVSLFASAVIHCVIPSRDFKTLNHPWGEAIGTGLIPVRTNKYKPFQEGLPRHQ